MKYTLILALVGLFSMSAFAGTKESKCIVKLKYKVEREGNRQYLWCLDDFDEDGPRYFYTVRRYKVKGVSKEECEGIANDAIGESTTLKFIAAPAGFVVIEQDPYECEGTVDSVYKIKYKPAKY